MTAAKVVTLPNGDRIAERRNGTSSDRDLRWWLMVGAVGLVISLASARLGAVEKDLRQVRDEQMDRGARIVRLEEAVLTIKETLGDLRYTQVKMNDKLDAILSLSQLE